VETGVVVAGRDPVAVTSVGAAAGCTAGEAAAAERATSEAVLVLNPTGLHARPAAMLAGLAKKHEGAVRLQRGTEQVNAKSLVAVMGLSVAKGDKVQVIATGPGARAAVDELAAAIADGLGEDVSAESVDTAAATALPAPTEAPLTRRTSDDPNLLLGVAASPGVAVGTVFQWQRHRIDVTEEASDKHLERRKLNSALDRSILQQKALEDQLKQQADAVGGRFAAHQGASDPDFSTWPVSIDRTSAPGLGEGLRGVRDRLAGLSTRSRARGRRQTSDAASSKGAHGQSRPNPDPARIGAGGRGPHPSDTATPRREQVAGFCTTGGGATSHVAIIARCSTSRRWPASRRGARPPAGSQVVPGGTRDGISVTDDEVARCAYANSRSRRSGRATWRPPTRPPSPSTASASRWRRTSATWPTPTTA
jgi:phosphocarrier protein FPr